MGRLTTGLASSVPLQMVCSGVASTIMLACRGVRRFFDVFVMHVVLDPVQACVLVLHQSVSHVCMLVFNQSGVLTYSYCELKIIISFLIFT